MNHFKSLYLLVSFSFLPVVSPTQAATFCVSTSQELQNALTSAEDNGQADNIKINQGTYFTQNNSGFQYDAAVTENLELKITGGWADFFGTPCGHQPSKSPFVTTLNANFIGRIMTIYASSFSDVTVSNLTFRNGLYVSQGAGLSLLPDSNYLGDVLVENCAFINNEAPSNSALSSNGGHKVIIRNNLFAFNHSNSTNASIKLTMLNESLTPNDSRGIYFTNNTVYANTSSTNTMMGGLFLHIQENSKAFIANNIFWDNDVYDLFLFGDGYKYLVNNDIEKLLGSADVEDNNISIAPRFESGFANFHLSASSALIDAGLKPPIAIQNPPTFDETWSLGEFDIEGNSRIQSGQVDMGAYESPFNSDIIFHHSFEFF